MPTPRRNQRACGHRTPAMAACGHAALRGSTEVQRKSRTCSGGHKGRPYDTISTWSVGRGAHTPPNQRACGHRTPVMAACGHAALRGSAGVRRESRACSGGHKGRPYDTISTWSVGRGAHTPPMQAAGITMACGFRNPVMAACGHAALSYEAKSLAECSCQIVRCCLRYFSCPWR